MSRVTGACTVKVCHTMLEAWHRADHMYYSDSEQKVQQKRTAATKNGFLTGLVSSCERCVTSTWKHAKKASQTTRCVRCAGKKASAWLVGYAARSKRQRCGGARFAMPHQTHRLHTVPPGRAAWRKLAS